MITNNYATGYNVGDGDDGDDESRMSKGIVNL